MKCPEQAYCRDREWICGCWELRKGTEGEHHRDGISFRVIKKFWNYITGVSAQQCECAYGH